MMTRSPINALGAISCSPPAFVLVFPFCYPPFLLIVMPGIILLSELFYTMTHYYPIMNLYIAIYLEHVNKS